MIQATCPECGYVYVESVGAPRDGYPAGTPWGALPADFTCPDCAVRAKEDFVVQALAD